MAYSPQKFIFDPFLGKRKVSGFTEDAVNARCVWVVFPAVY